MTGEGSLLAGVTQGRNCMLLEKDSKRYFELTTKSIKLLNAEEETVFDEERPEDDLNVNMDTTIETTIDTPG